MTNSSNTARQHGKEYAALIVDVIDFQRREQNLSRAELARRSKIPLSTLRRLLDGRGRLTVGRWVALADALSVSVTAQVDLVEDIMHARYWPASDALATV